MTENVIRLPRRLRIRSRPTIAQQLIAIAEELRDLARAPVDPGDLVSLADRVEAVVARAAVGWGRDR